MLFVLSGPWGVGKSEAIKYLSDNYGFQTLIPWSTEVTEDQRGTKYNLLLNRVDGYKKYTQEQLSNMTQYFTCPFVTEPTAGSTSVELHSKEVGFWCQPFINSNNFQVLGYRIAEILDISNQNAVVIEADTFVAQQLKIASEKGYIGRVINIFLNYGTDDCFKERLGNAQNYSEYDRKLKKEHRTKELSFHANNTGIFEHYICSDSISEIVQDIVNISIQFIRETPNMLHKKSGILSELDIQLAIESKDVVIEIQNRFQSAINNSLRIDIYKDGRLDAKAVKSSSIDLFLSPECRVLRKSSKKQIDLVLGEKSKLCEFLESNGFSGSIDTSQVDNLNRVCQLVDDSRTATYKELFQEHEISLKDGLMLQPQEIVLCSSLESISTGSNIITFITSKYSFSQIGLSISLNQNILQPGHKGKVMFQMINNLPYPIVVYPYMQIAQCIFFRTISDSITCVNQHDDFSFPRYDTSLVFKELSKGIISRKNWADINRRRLQVEQTYESQKIIQEKRAKIMLWVSLTGGIVGFLSFFVNVLLKLLVP